MNFDGGAAFAARIATRVGNVLPRTGLLADLLNSEEFPIEKADSSLKRLIPLKTASSDQNEIGTRV
jgi:hypothetical protein